MRSLLLVVAALGLGAGSLAAQTNTVTIGRANAHPTRILAKFRNPSLLAASTNSLAQLGSKIHRQFKLMPGLVLLEATDAEALAAASAKDEPSRRARLLDRIGRLRKSKLFEYAEPDYVVKADLAPTDQAFVNGTLWALRNFGQGGGKPGADIAATNAWNITTGSSNVIVAVIDTGIRYTHFDLANQMWHNPGEVAGDNTDNDNNGFVDDVFGINAITMSGDPFDDNDHGTHVSGTIGAAANDGNPSVGVTWHVQLMACKFLSSQGFGFTADAITCIGYAVSKGARILNNSWGGGSFSFALYDAINLARNNGVLFVAAAGNNGLDNDQYPMYPANYPLDNIISVAALDRNDNLASFSDYGATTVHLGAPGVAIYSTTAGSDMEYQIFDGTSMATPHVCGVAALVLSQFPSADLTELRQRILSGTVPIPALAAKTTTGGRLNAYNALTLSGSGVLQLSVTPPSGSTLLLNTDQTIAVRVTDLFNIADANVSAIVSNGTQLDFLSFIYAGQGVYTNALNPNSTNQVTMTVIANSPGKIAGTNIIYYNVVPRPANDDFADATKVPTGGALYLANNQFASRQPGEPAHAGVSTAAGSLWWSWMPTANTNALIDTTGSMIDTVLAVYTGNSLGSLSPVASTNDVGQDRQAYLRFNAQAGTTYRIAVASLDTNSLGSLVVRLAPGGQLDITPPQIFCTNLSGLTFTDRLISVGGTAVDPAPNATGLSEVQVSVNGSFTYSAAGTTNWFAPVALQPGLNVITAIVADRAGNVSSPVSVQANYFVNDPPNDVFANAIPLLESSGTASATNTFATKEVGEPSHAGNTGGKSVWWSWTNQPDTDGVLILSTEDSSFDTLLGLYTGTSVSNLTTIASNDDVNATNRTSSLTQAVRSNQVYHIAVDGYDGLSGIINLTYSFVPATVYHLTVNSTPGGVASPPSTDVRDRGFVTLSAVPDANYLFDYWDGDVIPVFRTRNPVLIQVVSNMTVTAHFRAVGFTDDFESGDLRHLTWATAGTTPWLVQTNVVAAGRYAAGSGRVANNQSSSLLLTTNLVAGDLSFDYRVSSETNWDFLEFYVNDALVQRWSGDVGWANFVFPVTASGTYALEWRYAKDASLSAGLDAAFVDNVNLPLLALESRRFEDGTFLVDLRSPTNQTVVIQSSTNLVHWDNIATNVPTDALMRILAPPAQTRGARFYRAVIP